MNNTLLESEVRWYRPPERVRPVKGTMADSTLEQIAARCTQRLELNRRALDIALQDDGMTDSAFPGR